MRFACKWFVVMFCVILTPQLVQAQNQPCDVIVNTGATGCIYEIVGQDQCPVIPSAACPGGCAPFYFPPPLGGWEIACNRDLAPVLFAYVATGTNATAPKWSAPPAEGSGKLSAITSAKACGIHYRCDCKADLEDNKVKCISEQCGLSILWTLAKNPNVDCVIAHEPPGDPVGDN